MGDKLKTLPADQWFPMSFSVNEAEFLRARDRYFIDGRFANGWSPGRFSVLSVADLMRRVGCLPAATEKPRTDLVVRDGVDIGNLQATLRTEDQAMVQIASNFNCLEVVSRFH